MKISRIPFAVAICCFILSSSLLRAEDKTGGITVVATGTVKAKPTIVEMTAHIQGDAELAGDAVTKYQSNKRRAEKTIKELNIKGLTIVNDGLSMKNSMGAQAMQNMMRGMPAGNNKKFKLAVSETVTLRMTDIDKLSDQELLDSLVKILEGGLDGGMVIGGSTNPYGGQGAGGLATFKIKNVDKLKEQAFALAMQDARKQAERLAKLGGVKLGAVTSISQTPQPKKNDNNATQNYYYMMYTMMAGNSSSEGKNEFSSAKLKEIPVTVLLNVTFDIEK